MMAKALDVLESMHDVLIPQWQVQVLRDLHLAVVTVQRALSQPDWPIDLVVDVFSMRHLTSGIQV
jgi:hypothetical protein